MPINKQHSEFYPIAMDGDGWRIPDGYGPDDGVTENILAGYLDLSARRGSRTRLLLFQPGAFSTKPFVHEYWEEVFLVSGDLFVGSDAEGKGGERFAPPTYACRPPGIWHGPFRSEGGCLLLETHYFDPA